MKPAVLLLAHGTPDTPAGVAEFLRLVTGGRELPASVVEEIRRRYELIGHSPLTDITHRQAQALARRLDLPVYVGMRNWHPFIAATVRRMSADGIDRAAVVCLAPHQPAFATAFVESWHDHPALIRAFAQKLETTWRAACAETAATLPVVFTAHSVPSRAIEQGDPYETQARETAARVAAEVEGIAEWRFTFQSQGASGGAWLGPTVEETIAALRQQGHTGVVLQPIGFLADHVEVLYDIDVAFRAEAERHGMRLWRTVSLNDSPLLISALADLATAHLGTIKSGAAAKNM